MSHIMPDRVADLIPSARPKPAAPVPTPQAVSRFSAKRRPAAQIQAASQLDLIEARLEGPTLTPQVRETLLAQRSKADKVLCGVALRQSTAVLS
jgi:hypothetical protein